MDDEPARPRQSVLPVLGLIIAIVLGVVGWLIAPGVLHWMSVTIPNFAGNALPLSTTRPLFTVVLVALGVILFGLLAALIAPRKSHLIKETNLERERDELWRRQKSERDQARKGKGRT